MNVTSITAVSCSVATSSLESLPYDVEKSNQPERLLFLKCGYGKISVKHAFLHSSKVVFISLYWEDGCSGKTGVFCKHKSNSLHNQAVEVIFSLPRSGRDT